MTTAEMEKEGMSNGNIDKTTKLNEWLAIRKEAGLRIDAETAEVVGRWGECLDPYNIYPDLPDEYRGVMEWNWFARSPGSDVWVFFGDLPDATWDAIEKKLASQPNPDLNFFFA